MPGLGGALLFGSLRTHWPAILWPGKDHFAVGLINVVAAALLIDGDDFTLNDGYGMALNFEFDDNAAIAGDVAIALGPLTDAASVAAAIVAAINAQASSGFMLSAEVHPSAPDEVVVRSRVLGPVGNNATMTEVVGDGGFTVDANLTGGRALTGWLYVAERFMIDAEQRITVVPGWQGPRPVEQVRGPGYEVPPEDRPLA